jgi:hypothetical protein
MIPSAVRKSLRETGTWRTSNATTPRENAISVAKGIAQPEGALGIFHVVSRYIRAGTIMPPIAAVAGRTARLGSESSPASDKPLLLWITTA